MPAHLHYVEPFFGGGAVLFARDPDKDWYEGAPDWDGSAAMQGCSEVVNDIDWQLTNFWSVLRDQKLAPFFYRFVSLSPMSQDLFSGGRFAIRPPGDKPHLTDEEKVSLASAFFICYRQSRQGLGKDFATLSRNRTRRRMNEQASAWLSAVEGLPEAHERLRRVVILNDDAVKVIRREDGPRTHFYCDPPYLQETRTANKCYQYEMTMDDHRNLLSLLRTIKGTFQLSGYRNETYDTYAEVNGWRRVDIPIDNKASGKKSKPKMVESVWMNYG